jgi:hypothetical protein
MYRILSRHLVEQVGRLEELGDEEAECGRAGDVMRVVERMGVGESYDGVEVFVWSAMVQVVKVDMRD